MRGLCPPTNIAEILLEGQVQVFMKDEKYFEKHHSASMYVVMFGLTT